MEKLVQALIEAGPLTIVALAGLGLVYILGKLVLKSRDSPKPVPTMRKSENEGGDYSGPERRRSVIDLQQQIAAIGDIAKGNARGLEELSRQFVEHRHETRGQFARIDEAQRKNDTQTARELGEVVATLKAQSAAIERLRYDSGFRDKTPPNGNTIKREDS